MCGQVSEEICLAQNNTSLIASGAYHSFAILADRTLVGWGRNNEGESTIPDGLTQVVDIAGGRHHAVSLKSDGTVNAWGWNPYGQTIVPQNLNDVVSVSAGYYHSLALKSNGTVIGWGLDDYNTISGTNSLTDMIAIDAGEHRHSMAISKDGTVKAWGYSPYGEIDVPLNLTDVVQVSAGYHSSFALKSDGTVIGWGNNNYNILDIPTGLSDVVAIDAGYWHVLALKSDGTVVTWGWDGYDLDIIPEGLDDVIAISASGDGHSFALQADGTLVGWGRSSEGQLEFPDDLIFAIPCDEFGTLYDCQGTCGLVDFDECGVCDGPGGVYECGCSDIPDGECDCEGTTNLDICGYDKLDADGGEFLAEYFVYGSNFTYNVEDMTYLGSANVSEINFPGCGDFPNLDRCDSFEVRWTGEIFAEESGNYIFRSVTDDGVRLFINDEIIIDDWQDQGDTSNEATIQLDYGLHDLRMEYYDQGGGETAYLYWTTPTESETFIKAASNGYCDCSCNEIDCLGVCGGSAVVDECGVCGGQGITNEFCDCYGNVEDCNGVCGGSAEVDECGICEGPNICADNHVCNGPSPDGTQWVDCPYGADFLCATSWNDCYSDTGCDGTTGIPDCSGDGDCCPIEWLGDGWCDGENQAWGCDLSCYGG